MAKGEHLTKTPMELLTARVNNLEQRVVEYEKKYRAFDKKANMIDESKIGAFFVKHQKNTSHLKELMESLITKTCVVEELIRTKPELNQVLVVALGEPLEWWHEKRSLTMHEWIELLIQYRAEAPAFRRKSQIGVRQ